jgi:MFS transporter, DHA1 family, multidrug resistance protein
MPPRSDQTALPVPPSPALIGVLALLSAVPPLAMDMYLPAFPVMAEDLGTSAASIQLTLTAFLIGLAAGQLVIGPLSDKWGRRIPLVAGTALCFLSGAAAALAPSIEVLTAARFVQGFAGAAGVVIARAVISDRARGVLAARLFGLTMIISGIAPVAAPLLGTTALSILGWRGVLWVVAALTALMLVAVLAAVPESLPREDRHDGGLNTMLRSIGTVVKNRMYLGYTLTFAFGFAAMFAYISASPFVLQNVLGLSPAAYSLAFAANALGLMLVSALSTRLAGHFSLRGMLSAGVLALLAGTVLLSLAVLAGSSIWPVLVLLFCTVSSLGFILGNATSLALAEVPQLAGSASAVLGALQFGLGALVSPLVGLGGEEASAPMAVAMLSAASVAAAALFILARKRRFEASPTETMHEPAGAHAG